MYMAICSRKFLIPISYQKLQKKQKQNKKKLYVILNCILKTFSGIHANTSKRYTYNSTHSTKMYITLEWKSVNIYICIHLISNFPYKTYFSTGSESLRCNMCVYIYRILLVITATKLKLGLKQHNYMIKAAVTENNANVLWFEKDKDFYAHRFYYETLCSHSTIICPFRNYRREGASTRLKCQREQTCFALLEAICLTRH